MRRKRHFWPSRSCWHHPHCWCTSTQTTSPIASSYGVGAFLVARWFWVPNRSLNHRLTRTVCSQQQHMFTTKKCCVTQYLQYKSKWVVCEKGLHDTSLSTYRNKLFVHQGCLTWGHETGLWGPSWCDKNEAISDMWWLNSGGHWEVHATVTTATKVAPVRPLQVPRARDFTGTVNHKMVLIVMDPHSRCIEP